MNEKDKQKLILLKKISILLAVIVSIVVIAVNIINHYNLWSKLRDIETIRAYVESAGSYAILVYAALVFAQVIFLPIPSTVMNLVAVMLFDPWVTFAVTSICTILGSYVCFFIGRIFGTKLVSWFVGKEKTQKYADVLQKKGKLLFILMLVLPCFPDDVLCMVAGLSTMSLGYFSVTVILTRPVMIAVVSFFGRAAMDAIDTWGLPVSIGVILLVLVAVFLVIFRRDKKLKKSMNNK